MGSFFLIQFILKKPEKTLRKILRKPLQCLINSGIIRPVSRHSKAVLLMVRSGSSVG